MANITKAAETEFLQFYRARFEENLRVARLEQARLQEEK
jgi:hypothetical protein